MPMVGLARNIGLGTLYLAEHNEDNVHKFEHNVQPRTPQYFFADATQLRRNKVGSFAYSQTQGGSCSSFINIATCFAHIVGHFTLSLLQKNLIHPITFIDTP